MKFTRTNARKYGRLGGIASGAARRDLRSRKECTPEKAVAAELEHRKKRERERAAFSEFLNAKSGVFNGYDFEDDFYDFKTTKKPLFIDESDDMAECRGVHVGADGVKVVFFVEPKKSKKQVRFNSIVYVF
jgi:hypothetical protein